MFDIYEFIDSKAIREYNKQLATKFSPLEQAVIIYNSAQTTAEEKLAAWHKLLDTYSEEEFSVIGLPVEGDKYNVDILAESSYYQAFLTTVNGYENALRLQTNAFNAVFKIYINSLEPNKYIFSAYDKAYEYMCQYLQSLSTEQKAVISAIPLDDPDIGRIINFIFDSKGRLTEIDHDHTGRYGLDMIYIYVPLPFVEGDILRLNDGSNEYLIVHRTANREYFQHARDSSDMCITACCISHDGDVFYNDFGHYNIFTLERCSEDELPGDSSSFDKKLFLKLREDILNDRDIRFL